MKKLVLVAAMALAAFAAVPTAAFADGCYNCGSGSSNGCKQCRYGAKDTGDARKACEAKGCKISGTSSCSTAANVKVCKLEPKSESAQIFAFFQVR